MEKKTNSIVVVFLTIIVISLTILLLLDTYFFSTVTVRGDSMNPALSCGDRLLVDISTRAVSEIEYKDIVIFESPDDPEQNFVKRVIATEGQDFTISEGELVVDGENLCEEYIECSDYRFKNYPYVSGTVPENKVYLLGDNRNSSNDSRSFGYVSTN